MHVKKTLNVKIDAQNEPAPWYIFFFLYQHDDKWESLVNNWENKNVIKCLSSFFCTFVNSLLQRRSQGFSVHILYNASAALSYKKLCQKYDTFVSGIFSVPLRWQKLLRRHKTVCWWRHRCSRPNHETKGSIWWIQMQKNSADSSEQRLRVLRILFCSARNSRQAGGFNHF